MSELKNASEYYARTGRFPLEGLYLAPGLVVGSSVRSFQLFEAYKKVNHLLGVKEDSFALYQRDLPIAVKGNQVNILSGPAQYHRFIEKPDYLLARADRHITEHFQPIIHGMFDDAVVIELAIGDGKKTGEILKNFVTNAKFTKPFLFGVNDLIPALVKKAAREACWGGRAVSSGNKPHFPRKQVVELPGDFNSAATWKRIHEVIEPHKNDHQVTILSQGATIFNNPTHAQLPVLLENCGQLPDKTNFLISADCTLDKDALQQEYNLPSFHHLCLTSFTHVLWAANIPFDPRTVTDCRVVVEDYMPGHVVVKEVIETSQLGTLVQDDIRKVSFNNIKQELAKYGLDAYMRLIAGGDQFSKINHAFVVARRTDDPVLPFTAKLYSKSSPMPPALAG